MPDKKEQRLTLIGIIVSISGFLLIISLIPVIVFLYLMAPPWQGIGQTVLDFQKNEDSIILVNDYLVQSEYEQISISDYNWNGSMYISGHGYIFIDDKEIVTAIRKLQRKGYSSIIKQGNGISFMRWTGRNVGKGIVCSTDGNIPGESAFNFLTKIEPLLKDGWYYYEEDFKEWKKRNSSITE